MKENFVIEYFDVVLIMKQNKEERKGKKKQKQNQEAK